MVNKAIIMAAGKGSRMKSDSSKPMTKVGNKKLIQYGIDVLLNCGINNIYIIYSEYSQDVLKLKEIYPNINFVKQENVDGSLSSFNFIGTICNPPFWLLDCDIIFSDIDFTKMLSYIKAEESVYGYVAIVSTPRGNSQKYLKLRDNRIIAFDKKGFADGYVGGMIYLWNKFPSKEAKEFYKVSNSLGAFYNQLVSQQLVRPMFIDKLLDIDTMEEVIQVEKELKKILK